MRRDRPSKAATGSVKTETENVRLRFIVDELFKEKEKDRQTIAALEQMIEKLTRQRRMN